jgi:hypothetical protein
MHHMARGVVACAACLILLATACSGSATTSTPTPSGSPTGPSTGPSAVGKVEGPLVVAVGDVVCEPGGETTEANCQQAATAALAEDYDPRVVLLLGDLQYDDGELAAFESTFSRTWGRLRSITRPVPGNHDYHVPGATGYYTYFEGRQPGPPGYYAFDVGSWRIYALNSNCDDVDCDQEADWLDEDMAANPRTCSALTMHYPRYSSALHGSSDTVQPLWEVALSHGADLALAGHDHTYERFRPMDASGHPEPGGIRSFVVGTGGNSLYDWSTLAPGSVARSNESFGVLALRLGEGRFGWEFRTIDGDVIDSGTAPCV